MLKFLIICLVLLAAYGLVVVLLRRLTETSRQLGDLREQMARNDERLSQQMRDLGRQKDESNERKTGV